MDERKRRKSVVSSIAWNTDQAVRQRVLYSWWTLSVILSSTQRLFQFLFGCIYFALVWITYEMKCTLECNTVCPLIGSAVCTNPVRFVVPSCCASTSPTLLTVATVWLAMLKIVAAWGLGPPELRTYIQTKDHQFFKKMSLGKLLHEGLAGKYLEIFSSPGSKKADDLRN